MSKFSAKPTATLVAIRDRCDRSYYNESKPVVPDAVYDDLVTELNKRGVKPQVGCEPDVGKATLPYYLGSLDKFKPEHEDKLEKWLDPLGPVVFVVQDKLDGISCLLMKDKLYTRGNGIIGSDISHLIPALRLPKVPEGFAIRGELIMPLKKFAKYSETMSNPRNMVAGIVNAKSAREAIQDVNFVAYELLAPRLRMPTEQLMTIENLGFETVAYRKYNAVDIDVELLKNDLTEAKFKSEYDIDGIVIVPNLVYNLASKGNPKYARAFKVDDCGISAKVVGIEWNVSKHGLLKPRVEFEPVKLKDVTIRYATGYNAKYVFDNRIGKGAIVKLTRSGDVIPKILSVITPTATDHPSVPFRWNETKVDIIACDGSDEQDVKGITSFFEKIEAKYVSLQTVKKLYDAGYTDIFNIIDCTAGHIANLDGLSDVSAKRITESIDSALKKADIVKLLGASGALGMGIGVRKVEVLLEHIPELLEMKKVELSQICDVPGFSEKTGVLIVDNLKNAKEFLDRLKSRGYCKSIKKVEKQAGWCTGRVFVFSGFRSKEMENELVQNGGTIAGSVTKSVTDLVGPDEQKETSKIVKARSQGATVWTKTEFLRHMDDHGSHV